MAASVTALRSVKKTSLLNECLVLKRGTYISQKSLTTRQKRSEGKDPKRMAVDQQTVMPWSLKDRSQPGHGPQWEGRGLENLDSEEKPALGAMADTQHLP